MANSWGNSVNRERVYFGELQNHCRWWLQPWNEKMLVPWKKSYDQARQHIKKQRHFFAKKVRLVRAIAFSVVMYGFESWTIRKTECRRIDAFELCCWRRLLESPLDCEEIQPVHPKGNRSWIVIGRTDVEAEIPILWPPDAKNWLVGKTLMLGKIGSRRRRGRQRMRWLDGITT